MTRRLTTIGLLLAATAALLACRPAGSATAETLPDGTRLVALDDGRRIALRCQGNGAPTVIFEAGWGASSEVWSRVFGPVSAVTRACSYDRAGYGRSDMGPPPRDGAATARDLDAALKAAKIKGPYVVVGHSAGALYARLFAARRPGEVRALVLVDPSVEHQDRRAAEVFGPGAGAMTLQIDRAQRCLTALAARTPPAIAPEGCYANGRPAATEQGWRTQIFEAETLWGATSAQVDRIGGLLSDTPMIQLSAQPEILGPGENLKAEMHSELAATYERGELRIVRSGHMMMFDQPKAIIDAVLDALKLARAGT